MTSYLRSDVDVDDPLLDVGFVKLQKRIENTAKFGVFKSFPVRET